jgi:hypothetical protein
MFLSLDVLSICLSCTVEKLLSIPGTENITACKFLAYLFKISILKLFTTHIHIRQSSGAVLY